MLAARRLPAPPHQSTSRGSGLSPAAPARGPSWSFAGPPRARGRAHLGRPAREPAGGSPSLPRGAWALAGSCSARLGTAPCAVRPGALTISAAPASNQGLIADAEAARPQPASELFTSPKGRQPIKRHPLLGPAQEDAAQWKGPASTGRSVWMGIRGRGRRRSPRLPAPRRGVPSPWPRVLRRQPRPLGVAAAGAARELLPESGECCRRAAGGREELHQ